MEKGFAIVVSMIAVVAGVASVVACGDSAESTFTGGPDNDASTDSPGSFLIDSGSSSTSSSGGEGGVAKCEPTIASDYAANWIAPTKPSVPAPCDATTIGTYYDECLATIGKPDHQTRCDAWKGTNTACGQCIEPTNNAGPIQWYQNRFYYTLNVAGCIAIQQDKYGNGDCGYAYGAAVNCERDACNGCFTSGTSTFTQFRDCQKQAQNAGLCKTLEANQSTVCNGVTTSTSPDTKSCFNLGNGEDAKVFYSRVMGIFCGPT